MPGKVGVKIKAGRNLPVMDRGADTTDAYVEIKLGNVTHKTDVCRKSLNPQWNTDWFRFELDDEDLQDEPLQIRIMDHDTYSANDAIGKVNISLNPLCLNPHILSHGKGVVMSGWIPVFDTMHGIRGEVNLIVKVDLFSDANKFKQSSCGVQFFHSPNIPHGYRAQIIHGFVEELVVNDDPEYQWIDKIRTPRASNEVRQVVFLKLSGQVQRKIGLKALNLGANAVIGYTQCFDLEGDVGVVARGIGTAVTLIKMQEIQPPLSDNALIEEPIVEYLRSMENSKRKGSVSKFDPESSSNSSSDIVSKILGIDTTEKVSKNIILNKNCREKNEKTIQEIHESDEMKNLQQLFDQEDQRSEKRPYFQNPVQNFKQSSKSYISDKLKTLKPKIKDDTENVSLSSSYSDISRSRTSLQDLKGLLPFKKKKSGINRSSSEGCGMATLIVSSIMRGPSLQSISESHDGDQHLIEQKEHHKSESLSALPTTKRGTAHMKLKQAQTSEASISTTSLSSTTTEELVSECSESAPVPNEIVVVDADTVSMVVKTALAQDEVDEEENEWIKPGTTFDAGSERTLDKLSASNCKLHRIGTKISMKNSDPVPMSLEELQPVDPNFGTWIEPGSTTDEPEVDDKERRGSLLHDLKENITDTFHSLQEHIHLPSFTEGKHKSHHPSLLETAMETMLIEKVELLGIDPAACPEDLSDEIKEKESPPSKSESKVTSPSKSESKVTSPKKSSRASLKRFNFSLCRKKKKGDGELVTKTGLVGNAIQSMLLEQVNLAEEFAEHPSSPTQFDSICETESDTNETMNLSHKDEFSAVPRYSEEKPYVAVGFGLAPLAEPESTEIERFTIPAISFSHHQSPTKDSASYYSSEPQLCQTVVAPTLDPIESTFMSLTNLKLNSDAFNALDRHTVATNPEPTPFLSHSTSTSPYFTPATSPEPVTRQTPPPLTKHIPCPRVDHYNHSSSVKNNLIVARNTIKSSSYTDLSTNKAPMLAPFPFLKHHRSELASGTDSPAAGTQTVSTTTAAIVEGDKSPIESMHSGSHMRTESLGGKSGGINGQSPSKVSNTVSSSNTGNAKQKDTNEIFRRSSDSDLSVTPKGNSICVASDRLVAATALMRLSSAATKGSLNQDTLDMLEYPFLTMTKYPSGFIVHLGATVAARSVKLLERVTNPDEPEVRDAWWKEIRMEVRSHARSLGCNVVLGYSEITAISDDVCILSATGTAAVINMSYNIDPTQSEAKTSSKKDLMVSSLEDGRNSVQMRDKSDMSSGKEYSTSLGSGLKCGTSNTALNDTRCFMCHLPYQSALPFHTKIKRCAICKRAKVPDVLLATIELPERLQVTGRGSFIQAQVARNKKDMRNEVSAKEVSDALPFLEYELHRLLINKLKAKGMNAIFGLKTQVAIGEKRMALIATGTALYLSALPPPECPKIVPGNSWTDTAKLNELQKSLMETFERNREAYQLKSIDPDLQNGRQSDTDDSEDDLPELDYVSGGKDACVLEIDDIEDLEIITLLMEPPAPDGFVVVNTQNVPGLQDLTVVKNLQMFTQVWRARIALGHSIGHFQKHFHRIVQTIYFKLRTLVPCAICDLKFSMDFPEPDDLQLVITGMALGLGEASKHNRSRRKTFSGGPSTNIDTSGPPGSEIVVRKHSDEELIFNLDEDQVMGNDQPAATIAAPQAAMSSHFVSHSMRGRKTSPTRTQAMNNSFRYSRHVPVHDRYGVDITPLTYIPGGRIDKYLGNLDFFFIRETTSIRESGGISGFVHGFITEILAVVRAHVTALGGNAMVAFYLTELLLFDNPHRNQGQCLIAIGGDAVHVTYYGDE